MPLLQRLPLRAARGEAGGGDAHAMGTAARQLERIAVAVTSLPLLYNPDKYESDLQEAVSNDNIDVISILLSLTVICSKGWLAAYSLHRPTFVFNSIAIAADVACLFAAAAWAAWRRCASCVCARTISAGVCCVMPRSRQRSAWKPRSEGGSGASSGRGMFGTNRGVRGAHLGGQRAGVSGPERQVVVGAVKNVIVETEVVHVNALGARGHCRGRIVILHGGVDGNRRWYEFMSAEMSVYAKRCFPRL